MGGQWSGIQKLLCANTSKVSPNKAVPPLCLGSTGVPFNTITSINFYQTTGKNQTAILQVQGDAFLDNQNETGEVTQLFALGANNSASAITSFYGTGSAPSITTTPAQLAGVACGNEYCLIVNKLLAPVMSSLFFSISSNGTNVNPQSMLNEIKSDTDCFGIQYDGNSGSFLILTGKQNSDGTWNLTLSSLAVASYSTGSTQVVINDQLSLDSLNKSIASISIGGANTQPKQAFKLYVSPSVRSPYAGAGTPNLFLKLGSKLYANNGSTSAWQIMDISKDSQGFANNGITVARYKSLAYVNPSSDRSTDAGYFYTPPAPQKPSAIIAVPMKSGATQIQVSSDGGLYALQATDSTTQTTISHYDVTSKGWSQFKNYYSYSKMYPLTNGSLAGNGSMLLLGNGNVQVMSGSGELLGKAVKLSLQPISVTIGAANEQGDLLPQQLFIIGGTAASSP